MWSQLSWISQVMPNGHIASLTLYLPPGKTLYKDIGEADQNCLLPLWSILEIPTQKAHNDVVDYSIMYKRDKYVPILQTRNLSIHYYYYRFNKLVLVQWFSLQVMYNDKSKMIKINLTSNHNHKPAFLFACIFREFFKNKIKNLHLLLAC